MFDAHAHLHDQRIAEFYPAIVENAAAANITGLCNCGTSPTDWSTVAELTDSPAPFVVVPGFGVHPWYVTDLPAAWAQILMEYLEAWPTAIVGEIGLDGIRKDIPITLQQSILEQQLEIAVNLARPVVLHGARAWSPLLDIVQQYAASLPGFVVHGFASSQEIATRIIKLGGYISFAGQIVNPNAEKLRKTILQTPLNRILLESDTPDLMPFGGVPAGRDQKGKPLNQLSNLTIIADTMAQLLRLSIDTINDITAANARRVLLY